MSNDPQPPRCKCGHARSDHWYWHATEYEPAEENCLKPSCGCGSWRPAETAR